MRKIHICFFCTRKCMWNVVLRKKTIDVLIERDRHKNEVCKKNGIEIIYAIDKNYSVMDGMHSKENTCNIKNLENVLKCKLK